jgi:MOSC domain-containing protein YiiM
MLTIGPYRFTDTDASRTFSNLGMWWHHLTDGIDASSVDPIHRALVDELTARIGTPPVAGTPSIESPESIERLGRQAAEHFDRLGYSVDAATTLAHVWDSVRSAMATLRRSGVLPASGTGTVARINVSDGGVPKRPVTRVEVNHRGIVGDRQKSRQHHGRPWQALSLWSTEVIDAFAAQGHPLRAGAAGENLTLTGLDWSNVRPGMLLRIGSVLAETTSWAIPCRHNAQWFTDGDFRKMSHERGAVSRLYATVLEPGTITAGDSVTVQSEASLHG